MIILDDFVKLLKEVKLASLTSFSFSKIALWYHRVVLIDIRTTHARKLSYYFLIAEKALRKRRLWHTTKKKMKNLNC